MEIATAAEGQSEAVIRMPVPRGAAVTDAVLWVNDKPMRGAFVERQRAQNIYTSIVTRRRDPALVTWAGPGWIGVSIYPLEKNRSRRFELEWIEPAAEAEGRVLYHAPVVSEGERVVGHAAVTVDGRKIAAGARDLIAIGAADPRKVFTRRAPGDPFQQVMVREAGPIGAPHFVLVAETSVAMTIGDRQRQRAALNALVAELPADAKLTLLAADWDVSPIAEEAGPDAWRGALAKLDAIPSAGALHLERALHEATARARKTGAAAVLFVGRGDDGFGGDAVSGPVAEMQDARVRLSASRPATRRAAPRSSARRSTPAARLSRSCRQVRGFARAARRCAAAAPGPAGPRRARRRRVAPAPHDHGRRRLDGTHAGNGRPRRTARRRRRRARRWPSISASLWDRARLEWHDRDVTEEVAKRADAIDVTAGARDRAGLPALRPRGPGAGRDPPLRRQPRAAVRRGAERATPASSAC